MEINLKTKKKTVANINKLFNRRNNAIKFVDDYNSMVLEAKRKTAREEPATKLAAKPEVATEPTKVKN